ncbi:DUF2510 domain-containing protein [Microbacterium sp. CFH 90308]|uniref:DUF2510 domain-containing protein n=1 Tax=Microbacterium salsuginis TaxID=2722803 RepID=A0ABX1K9Y2_9MICO|nr:DUF2510 domain-containing protein [Microbacterium sp. CFH 90308]NLP82793.1 DUF2510 domain-containing protein [Microbacterium sp. CFH 90308]
MTTHADPGWYDDGTGKQRWWDGTRWTEEYIDLREHDIELHRDAAPAAGAAAAGWYDDQRGRLRWWDGRQWTTAVRYSGEEQEFADVIIDGRWIHFGESSQPVAGAQASVETGDALLRRPAFTRSAVDRRLVGRAGAITPRTLNRIIQRPLLYLVITGTEQVWVTTVPQRQDAPARRFASWVNTSAEHYRYR